MPQKFREKFLRSGVSNKDRTTEVRCELNIRWWVELQLMQNVLTKEKEGLLLLTPLSLVFSHSVPYLGEINGKGSLRGYFRIIEIPIQVLGGESYYGTV